MNYEDRNELGFDAGPEFEEVGVCEYCDEEDAEDVMVINNQLICRDCLDQEDARSLDDGPQFADPGGNSALRAATEDNPRNLPCPSCGEPDKLTPEDKAHGYQCDGCADQAERGY